MRTKPDIHPTDTDRISRSAPNDDNILPLNSSWLNDTTDSDSPNSPVSLSISSTNVTSSNDNQQSISTSISSSKKRKSIPQKIIPIKR